MKVEARPVWSQSSQQRHSDLFSYISLAIIRVTVLVEITKITGEIIEAHASCLRDHLIRKGKKKRKDQESFRPKSRYTSHFQQKQMIAWGANRNESYIIFVVEWVVDPLLHIHSEKLCHEFVQMKASMTGRYKLLAPCNTTIRKGKGRRGGVHPVVQQAETIVSESESLIIHCGT